MEKYYMLKEEGTLIPYDGVEEVVCAFAQWWYLIDNTGKTAEELNNLLAGQQLEDEVEIEDWLNEHDIEHDEVRRVGDYLYRSDAATAVIYDAQEHEFFEFADLVETQLGWQYWDGSNRQNLVFDEADTQLVTIDDDMEISLDEWDGSNWRSSLSGKRFEHDLLYPVLEVDGVSVKEETWLLYSYTQWQGDIPVGRLLSAQEVEELIEQV